MDLLFKPHFLLLFEHRRVFCRSERPLTHHQGKHFPRNLIAVVHGTEGRDCSNAAFEGESLGSVLAGVFYFMLCFCFFLDKILKYSYSWSHIQQRKCFEVPFSGSDMFILNIFNKMHLTLKKKTPT